MGIRSVVGEKIAGRFWVSEWLESADMMDY